MHNLTLTLISSNLADADAIYQEMVIRVSAPASTGETAEVLFQWVGGKLNVSVEDGFASMLPGVHSDLHLVALVSGEVMKRYSEDHTFFDEIFSDDERGESVSLVLTID